MSERYRNDLYYLERVSGPVALYPNGKVGQIEEVKVEAVTQVKSRRPGRLRTIKYLTTGFAETAQHDTLAEYRAAEREVQAERRIESGYDHSWTIDDMPDEVIAQFNEWEKTLPTITNQDVANAAAPMVASEEELQTATVECPWCKGNQYACHGCIYARTYYKYPLIRLNDGNETYDTPLDVAGLLQANPSALSYETRTLFTHQGLMTATHFAVLRLEEMNGLYLGRDSADVIAVDKSDSLHGTIEIPLATWQEEGYPQTMPTRTVDGTHLPTVIAALQKKCVLNIREQTDTDKYQKLYDQFIDKIKSLGGGAIAAVVQGRDWGMGNWGYELSFHKFPFEHGRQASVARASTVRWLIEEALPILDKEKTKINARRKAKNTNE